MGDSLSFISEGSVVRSGLGGLTTQSADVNIGSFPPQMKFGGPFNLYHWWGQDLNVSPTGDLAPVDGLPWEESQKTLQLPRCSIASVWAGLLTMG